MRNRFLLLGLLMALICNVSWAQTQDGYLKGTVIDKKTGDPLSFANLRLLLNGVAKVQGQADVDGNYRLGPVSPGTYTLEAKYLGYPNYEISGIVIKGDQTVTYDVKLGGSDTASGIKLKETVIVHYKAPIFDRDNTTTQQTMTSKEIEKSPVRSINGLAATAAGTVAASDGLHINGQRSTSNVYFVDGIKTFSAPSIPREAIEQLAVITGGLPAEYGDVTGGVITITTKGPSKEFHGSVEGVTSQFIDPYGYNQLNGTFSGPLITKNKHSKDSARTIMGFFISGNATHSNVTNPSAIPFYQVNEDVLNDIRNNPLRTSPTGAGFVSNAEFVTYDQMYKTRVIPNNATTNYNFNGKVDFQPAPMVNISMGGQVEYGKGRSYNYNNLLFNSDNNAEVTNFNKRGWIRFRQFFTSNPNSVIKGANYTIQASYSRYNSTFQDARLGDNLWQYGYVGKFDVNRTPFYQYTSDTIDGKIVSSNYLLGYYDNGVKFTPSDVNPILSNYTSNFFNQSGEVMNYNEIQTGGGLLNGQTPPTVYSLWLNVGNNPNAYQKSETNRFSLDASGEANIKGHQIKFGLTYEESVYRAYTVGSSLGANALWTLGRLLANKHLQQLDFTSPIPLFDENGIFKDTVNYKYQIAAGEESAFAKNIRTRLNELGYKTKDGKPFTDETWVNIDQYDPDVFNMNMFSPNELLNDGNAIINYYGYDYLGNKQSGKPSFNDFMDPDKRTIGAYHPIYTAGYIQDKFEYKDLIFRVGIRVDRFDANQQVLKDPYSLYPVKTVSEVSSINGSNVSHPGNIGNDYVVYVDDALNPTKIVGYRSGSNWFDATGAEVSDPTVIALSSRSGSNAQPYLEARNEDEVVLSNASFKDYEPQINVMPRISFSFPISENSAFYANYDVLTQRPLTGNLATYDDYYFLNKRATITVPNPALKPEKKVNYELGFKQTITPQSAVSIKATYSEIRDLIQRVQIYQAYPLTYTTLGNIDFGTVKGITLGYDLKGLPVERNGANSAGVTITTNYTLQFANGTGSNAGSGAGLIAAGYPNLRTPFPLDYDVRHNINFILDYRFGWGAGYSGPGSKAGDLMHSIFENMGVNLQLNTRSGTPYTRQKEATAQALFGVAQRNSLAGTINGSRLPWQFLANLQVDKSIQLTSAKKEDGSFRNPLYMNVYVWVQNVLNSKNVRGVYRYTGLPNDDGYLTSSQGIQTLETAVDPYAFANQYNIKVNAPGNYVSPRIIRLGAIINF